MSAMRFISTLLLLTIDAAAQSGLPPEVLQLAQIRRLMTRRLEHTPDYTCTEIVQRSAKRPGAAAFRTTDTLRLNVAFAGGKEIYSWPGAKRFDDRDLGQIVGSGAISSGGFVAYARSVFLNQGAVIRFAGNETLRGRNVARYDYRLSVFQSGFTMRYADAAGTVGMSGSFWVDTETLDLLRLDVNAEEIPEYLPMAASHEEIDYGHVRLASANVMIPESVELTLTERDGVQKRNQVGFTACREYRADSSISFDPGPMYGAAIAGPKEVALPPGLTLSLELDDTIHEGQAAEGDLITAHLTADAVWNKKVLVPRGTLVTGRLRRLEKYSQPRPHYIVGLEFSEMEFDRQHASFNAVMNKVADLAAADSLVVTSSKRTEFDTAMGHEIRTDTSIQEILPGRIPGVGTFVLQGSRLRLEKGLRMEWQIMEWQIMEWQIMEWQIMEWQIQ